MKVMKNVVDVSAAGNKTDCQSEPVKHEILVGLLGEKVTFFCGVYIYTGTLVGVSNEAVALEGTQIVYETGSFSDAKWKDAQGLCNKTHYIMHHSIESFGKMK